MAGAIPLIPHLAGMRREWSDLRLDTDEAFTRVEGELDAISANLAPAVPPITTDPIVTLTTANILIRCNSAPNAQSVLLPAITESIKGQLIIVKAVDGAIPGAPLSNNVTIIPSGTNQVDRAANYVLSTQHAAVGLRCDGVSSWEIVAAYLPTSPTPPVSGGDIFDCPASIVVGDAVYLDSSGEVDKAFAGIPTTPPAIGIVVEKPTTTSARVVALGKSGSVFVGLVAGSQYYLSDLVVGGVTDTPPDEDSERFQIVGTAVSASEMYIAVDRTFTIL
jgi:hypothetical protein